MTRPQPLPPSPCPVLLNVPTLALWNPTDSPCRPHPAVQLRIRFLETTALSYARRETIPSAQLLPFAAEEAVVWAWLALLPWAGEDTLEVRMQVVEGRGESFTTLTFPFCTVW